MSRSLTIGLVDDDLSVRKGLTRFLRSAGCSVYAYGSAEDCLSSSTFPSIECFIVDIHLGGMSGFDFQRCLESAGPHPPIVFITAYDEAATREALSAAGSPACLRKPFPPDALLATIENAVGLH